MIKLSHQANDCTNRQFFLIFCKIPRNFADISKFCRKGQILQLGSKFRDPWKTVGPTHQWVMLYKSVTTSCSEKSNPLSIVQ